MMRSFLETMPLKVFETAAGVPVSRSALIARVPGVGNSVQETERIHRIVAGAVEFAFLGQTSSKTTFPPR